MKIYRKETQINLAPNGSLRSNSENEYPHFMSSFTYCGRPWPAAYINFNQNIHQIQVLTKPLCRAQAVFYLLPNNEWGTKYHGLTYNTKLTVCEICSATYSARQARLRI